MFYLTKNDLLISYANYKFADDCKETNILTVEELEAEPFRAIVQEGELVLNPNYEAEKAQKEAERVAKLSLTKREVFLGLYEAKGVTPEQIKAQITEPATLIEFEYANDYFRGNPLIDSVGAVLGITPAQLDCFFETKDPNCLKDEV